jgi:hypothetical protein
MSEHPRSLKGEKTKKEKIENDLEEKYLDGATTPSEYEKAGDYSLFAVRTHYRNYPEAVNEIGFPAPKDVPGIYEELADLKDKWGMVNEEVYDAKGFFRSEGVGAALGMDWDEINDLL